MKRKDDTLAILFVTALTIVVWFWAANNTKEDSNATTLLNFTSPNANATVNPNSLSIELFFSGPRTAVNSVKDICAGELVISVAHSDEEKYDIDLVSKLNQLDAIKNTGATVTATKPNSIKLNIQTMDKVTATVKENMPDNVTISGDVTIDPATVTLLVPKENRKELPEAISVFAKVNDVDVKDLKPGIVHNLSAAISLTQELIDAGATAEPNKVEITFKIRSNMDVITLPKAYIKIAASAEDYAKYTVSLEKTSIQNVGVQADKELISRINSGEVAVYAIVHLSETDMEQLTKEKAVTSFIAIDEEGKGIQVEASVEDPVALNVTIEITPITQSNP